MSRGLKPEFVAGGGVRHKSRTYLRDKSNSRSPAGLQTEKQERQQIFASTKYGSLKMRYD